MLKDFEKSKHEEKDVLNEEIKALRARLIGQQQLIREGLYSPFESSGPGSSKD